MTNTGDQTLEITSIVVTSTDYAQTNTCGSTLVAGASCTLTITFSPTKTGQDFQFINITDNASTSPQEFNLYGTGVTGAGKKSVSRPSSDTVVVRHPADEDDDD
jgi:hypothetical protein